MVKAELIDNLRFEVPVMEGRQERSTQTINKIIEAAITSFADRGYDDTSTHDVAERAGVNQGLITYHFKTKLGMWQSAVDRLLGGVRNNLASRMYELREVDAPIYLKLIIREFVRSMAQNPSLLRLLIEESKKPTPRLKWLADRHIRPVYEAVTMLLKEGQEQGVIRPLPLLSLYYHFVSSSLVFALAGEVKCLTDEDVYSPEFVETHADCFIDMLFTKNGGNSS